MKQLDEYTFGNSTASIILAELLSAEDKVTRKSVLRFIEDFNRGLKCLNDIEDVSVRLSMSEVWYTNARTRCDQGKHTSKENLNSFVHNVLHYRHVNWFKSQPILELIHSRQAGKRLLQ